MMFENLAGKGENGFPTMFSVLKNFSFSVTCHLLNLDKSEILLFSKELRFNTQENCKDMEAKGKLNL